MTFMSDFVKRDNIMAIIHQKLGEKVRKLRKSKGYTQEDLAAKIKRDVRTVVAIETGKRNSTITTVYNIARTLGVKLSQLFDF